MFYFNNRGVQGNTMKMKKRQKGFTIALEANPRISLIARGALFLNDTPCT